MDIISLKKLFQNSADIKFQRYSFNGHIVHFITCEAMVNQQLLHKVILNRVEFLCNNLRDESIEIQLKSNLYIPDLKKVTDEQEAISLVYKGFLLLYFEDGQLLFSSNISNKPNRKTEQTFTEVVLKGPRDNFIEDIAVNIALIRKRLPTNSLCVSSLELGKRSKTRVAILYFDDIVNKNILDQIINHLKKVDTDAVFSGEILMEHINTRYWLFPRHEYTGRPDYTIQSLIRGRFVILVDGVSYALITPVNLFMLFKTSEDNEYPAIVGSVERILRILSVLIATGLPGFWLALISHHPNQLPFQLLATIIQSRSGLPFPGALEMLLMLAMFELFREAGLRLPSVLGAVIGIVGGIIIGNAAIRSGITSPSMIVIIAASIIASYTLVNQSFVTAVSILRVIFVLFSALFGFFGFFTSLFFLITYLSNIRVFEVPYLNIALNLNWKTIGKTIFRLPAKFYKKRPEMLKTKDKTRS